MNEDDDDDLDDNDQGDEEPQTDHLVLAQFDKVQLTVVAFETGLTAVCISYGLSKLHCLICEPVRFLCTM